MDDDLNDVFRDRHYNPGYVYIAGSLEGHILKIGTTSKIAKQEKILRYKGYGDLKDWVLLYHVFVSCGGKIEHEARTELPRVVSHYSKDGRRQRGRELVRCNFSRALSSLLNCIGEEDRKSEWKIADTKQYEFDDIQKQKKIESAKRYLKRFGHADVAFDPIHLNNIEILDLKVSTIESLRREGVTLIGDLVQLTEGRMLLGYRDYGFGSAEEVIHALAKLGLSLGNRILQWDEHKQSYLASRKLP